MRDQGETPDQQQGEVKSEGESRVKDCTRPEYQFFFVSVLSQVREAGSQFVVGALPVVGPALEKTMPSGWKVDSVGPAWQDVSCRGF